MVTSHSTFCSIKSTSNLILWCYHGDKHFSKDTDQSDSFSMFMACQICIECWPHNRTLQSPGGDHWSVVRYKYIKCHHCLAPLMNKTMIKKVIFNNFFEGNTQTIGIISFRGQLKSTTIPSPCIKTFHYDLSPFLPSPSLLPFPLHPSTPSKEHLWGETGTTKVNSTTKQTCM